MTKLYIKIYIRTPQQTIIQNETQKSGNNNPCSSNIIIIIILTIKIIIVVIISKLILNKQKINTLSDAPLPPKHTHTKRPVCL